jgi:hypothetical protein
MTAWVVRAGRYGDAEPTAFLHPSSVQGDQLLHLASEPVWLIKAPKHSSTDVVRVFRGVAMTGDIELGMLASVNHEVFHKTKMESMERLRDFQDRAGYQVHSVVSAHLNDVRLSVNWPDLFSYSYSASPPHPSSPDRGKRWQCRRYGCWGNLVPIHRVAEWSREMDKLLIKPHEAKK